MAKTLRRIATNLSSKDLKKERAASCIDDGGLDYPTLPTLPTSPITPSSPSTDEPGEWEPILDIKNEDASMETSNTANLIQDNAPTIEDLDPSPYEDDTAFTLVDDGYLDPRREYIRAFPYGHEIIETPTDGLLCGFFAIILSMENMHPYLPCPTIADLQEILTSPAFKEYSVAFGMTNEDNFSIDQVAAVLFTWGCEQSLNIRIGVVPDGQAPLLMPHPNEWSSIIVWIHNDGLSNDEGRLGHYSGMRPKEV